MTLDKTPDAVASVDPSGYVRVDCGPISELILIRSLAALDSPLGRAVLGDIRRRAATGGAPC